MKHRRPMNKRGKICLKIAQFAGIAPREGLEYERDFFPAMMNALFNSNSWIAIVMITDLLARKDRFNVPGTATARRIGHGVCRKRLSKCATAA